MILARSRAFQKKIANHIFREFIAIELRKKLLSPFVCLLFSHGMLMPKCKLNSWFKLKLNVEKNKVKRFV